MRYKILLIIIIFTCFSACKKNSDKISNLVIFAKVYGYVKYFHPSEEASNIDWNTFAAYGAKKIIGCTNKKEILLVLDNLFRPIAPSIRFTTKPTKYDIGIITPLDTSSYKSTYWQHLGLSLDMNYNYNIYKSSRVNGNYNEFNKSKKKERVKGSPIFEVFPKFGEVIEKQIYSDIYCQIPLHLYSKDNSTYPSSNSIALLKKELQIEDKSISSLSVRLGNIINTYNVFKHFYPYFQEVDVDWDKEFKIALERSFNDNSKDDHQITLEKFTATLNDGHLYVRNLNEKKFFQPPFHWQFVEDSLFITHLFDDVKGLKVGDVIRQINGKDVNDVFRELKLRISAATDARRLYIAEGKSLFGKKNSKISVKVNNETLEFNRSIKYNIEASLLPIQRIPYKCFKNDIYYLNLFKISMDTINKLLPKLENANGIICDLRIFPKGNHNLISHFLKEKDTAKGWMKIPKIIYPDQEKIIGHEEYELSLKTKKPYLGNKKIIFLTGPAAISYAETYMSLIEGYSLAYIIGQPTAGTNGSLNSFRLLGNYNISWTGMRVKKLDGSQHHGIGIQPDLLINRTIEGIRTGKDEVLDKALEIINN